METVTISTQRSIENAGHEISRAHADYLTEGFKLKFPKETQSVFISKETIMQSVSSLDNVVGLHFMYGYKAIDVNGVKTLSRILVLIPCKEREDSERIDLIFLPNGYYTNTGEKLSVEQTKLVLYNHAVHFAKYFSGSDFNKVIKGAFIGINSLIELLGAENCAGINFKFGFDARIDDVTLKNKPTLEAVDNFGNFISTWGDGPICPPICFVTNLFGI